MGWLISKLADQIHLTSANPLGVEAADTERVLVVRRPSYLERALLRELCARMGIAQPRILPLRNRTGSDLFAYFRRLHRRTVESAVAQSPAETKYVPVGFFPGRGPKPIPRPLLWPVDFPAFPLADIWLLLVFLVHRKALGISVGRTLSKPLEVSNKEFIKRLSRELYRLEKVARGARQQQHVTVEAIVLSDRRLEATIAKASAESGIAREQLYHQAQKNLNEIAASIKGWAVYSLYQLLGPIIRAVFSEIQVENLEELKAAIGDQPVALLPSHRSHFDYIVLSYVLYQAKLPLPYIAAGANLNFWPAGPFVRATGGFFIRRSIGGDEIYKSVLDVYLQYLLKQGHLLEFFIEGGRSRTGGMRMPRLGLLKYLIRSWEAGSRRDLTVVPIGITYERLAEEKSLASELAGGSKEKENAFALLKLRRIKSRRFGSVVVVIGKPQSLKALRNSGLDADGAPVSLERFTEDVGFSVSRSIRDSMALTGISLGAAAVQSMGTSMPRAALETRVTDLFKLLAAAKGVSDAPGWQTDQVLGQYRCRELRQRHNIWLSNHSAELLTNHSLGDVAKQLVSTMKQIGFLEQAENSADQLQVPQSQYFALEYYKNSLLHLFTEPAAIAYAALTTGRLDHERLFWFHQFFKPVFVFPFFRVWSVEIQGAAEQLPYRDERGRIDVTPLLPALTLLQPYFDVLVAGCKVLQAAGEGAVSVDERMSDAQFAARRQELLPFVSRPYDEAVTQYLKQCGLFQPAGSDASALPGEFSAAEQHSALSKLALQLQQTVDKLQVASVKGLM